MSVSFKSNVRVRYQETDKMGVVHHSVYPVWYEESRIAFMDFCNVPYKEIEDSGIMFPLSKLECKYIKPAKFDDFLTIETTFKKLSPVKADFEYKIYKDDVLINVGATEHPFVTLDFKLINLKHNKPELYNVFHDLLHNK